MTGIPLVNSNSVNDINTSIIAIKKEMKSSGETEVNVNVNLPDTAIPVDEVTSGNMHSVTSNAVAEVLSYSTSEKKTGKKWIDGKWIYRKVFANITITNGTTILTNVSSLVAQYGMMFANNVGVPFPRDAGSQYEMLRINTQTHEVYFDASDSRDATITVEYTKTTD